MRLLFIYVITYLAVGSVMVIGYCLQRRWSRTCTKTWHRSPRSPGAASGLPDATAGRSADLQRRRSGAG